MRFRNIIRDYFTFTRSERIGLYVLILLIILLGIANQIIFYFETPGVADEEEFSRLVKMFQKGREKEPEQLMTSLFRFNPNSIDSVSLDSLQLPTQIKTNLLRYRQKGGRFKYKDDFKKLYGMNDSIFLGIKNYLQLESKPIVDQSKFEKKRSVKPTKIKQKDFSKVEKEFKQIEINRASEVELKSISGVGEVLSKRIVKYRNLLGGFYRVEQLREVYGLSEENYQQIEKQIIVDPAFVKKIDINFANETELVRHPYISWKEVNAILSYRNKNGFIKDLERLFEEEVFNDSVYQHILPYLRTKKQ